MGLPSIDLLSPTTRQNLWRADELDSAEPQVLSSGHPLLDAELPGGGWPVGALVELLQPDGGAPMWELLLPVLARAVNERGGPVALIGPPHEPFGAALAARGVPLEALLWVRSEAPAARLWACEQALRCGEVAAVLAWLPQARVGELRRLQLAAAQHEALLFALRPLSVAQSASPARLRLSLAPAGEGRMDLHILKRRGPPMAAPLDLSARGERLSALLAASQWRRRLRHGQALPAAPAPATVLRLDALAARGKEALDALGGLAMAA